MSEFQETSLIEQSVASPELASKITDAQLEILPEGKNPEAVAVRNIEELGFFQALWETAKPHTKKLLEINFKNLKAQGALVLSLIPVLGEGKALLSTVGIKEGFKAGKVAFQAEKGLSKYKAIGVGLARAAAENAPSAAKAGSLFAKTAEGSQVLKLQAQGAVRAENIAQNIAHGQYESVAAAKKALRDAMNYNAKTTKDAIDTTLNAAAKEAGKGGLGKMAYKEFEKRKLPLMDKLSRPEARVGVVHFLDLTPDVPGWLTFATGAAETVGVHGADAIPALLQIGKNSVDTGVTYGRLTKDVWNLVMNRINSAKDNKILTRATAAFQPDASRLVG